MKKILYRIEMYGIKNIKNLITLDFMPQTIDNKTKKNISKVKAIYGTNGVGKSAIINGIALAKEIYINSNLLKQNDEIIKINKLINKELKEFYISFIYELSLEDNEKCNIYKYELKIKNENKTPYINYEKCSILNDQSINGKYNVLYEIRNGDLLINIKSDEKNNNDIKRRTLNILKYSSLTSIISDIINIEMDKDLLNSKIIELLIKNKIFFDGLSLYLDEQDIHKECIENKIDLFIKNKYDIDLYKRSTISSKCDVINKKNYREYKMAINKLYNFLKLFKPLLKDIRIEYIEDIEYYYCTKKMVYENYEVDFEYESTGIQKLINIYNLIVDVTKSNIVFIDELDSNINGVYLEILIEFINKYATGQMCFTTHNYYPMRYLSIYVNSLDFLGETGKLVSWKKNGNYKPYHQYPEGMIMDSPFNIDYLDLVKVFIEDR